MSDNVSTAFLEIQAHKFNLRQAAFLMLLFEDTHMVPMADIEELELWVARNDGSIPEATAKNMEPYRDRIDRMV